MARKNRNRRPAAAAASTTGSAASPGAAESQVAEGMEPAEVDSDAHGAVVSDDANSASYGDDASGATPPVSDAHDADDAVSHPEAEAPVAPAMPRSIDPGAQLGSSQPSWSQHSSDDIRGVLIQVAGGRLLLPNATIAEVLSYAEPEAVDGAPEWLLGRFRWRGWQLPLVAFSRLSGIGEDKPGLGSKVIVLKSLGGDSRAPYFAVLTQGFPRLVTVSRDALQMDVQETDLPAGVQAFVRLNDEPALLPDLMQIEQRLRETRDAA